jgi:hypothetical protein
MRHAGLGVTLAVLLLTAANDCACLSPSLGIGGGVARNRVDTWRNRHTCGDSDVQPLLLLDRGCMKRHYLPSILGFVPNDSAPCIAVGERDYGSVSVNTYLFVL